ncbi:MAG: SDR family NAD(P)-dependent oxidoreductase, partial [Candidatus Kapabacteria bacterium]|nr:SDR family NAD(P)-dependent oxidoreductase [Candidatus Kapabacteria bacterium]
MPRVLITGAARRLGRALAEGFAQRGWDVAIHYWHSEAEARELEDKLQSYGIQTLTVQADLRVQEHVWRALTAVAEYWGGPPEVLVNNAGVYPPRHTLTELSPVIWENALQVNLTACLYASQAFASLQRGEGKIVNIASLGGLRTWRQRTAYNVSKAALLQLTRNLALELAPRIAVNAVCPGVLVLDPSEKPTVGAESIP